MATFNSKMYIKDFFESFSIQDRNNVELIIIDSCSTDGTLDEIKNYKYLISKLVIEKDRSIYEAWNKGLKLADGEWICFIGSDDFIEVGGLRIIKDSIKQIKNDTNLVIFNSIFVDQSKKAIKCFESSFDKNKFKNKFTFSHPMTLHKKDLFRNTEFSQSYGSSGDYHFLLSNIEILNPIVINKNIVRIRQDGVSQNINSIKSSFKVRKELRSVCLIKNIYNFLKATLSWKLHQIIKR